MVKDYNDTDLVRSYYDNVKLSKLQQKREKRQAFPY